MWKEKRTKEAKEDAVMVVWQLSDALCILVLLWLVEEYGMTGGCATTHQHYPPRGEEARAQVEEGRTRERRGERMETDDLQATTTRKTPARATQRVCVCHPQCVINLHFFPSPSQHIDKLLVCGGSSAAGWMERKIAMTPPGIADKNKGKETTPPPTTWENHHRGLLLEGSATHFNCDQY